eukprot:gnl/TRDRNA2_/TRDRNA2_185334_c0_seq1.p1 gnl/TRDRNA2_/TRDRNA2_185334_c0~~gnl/TRDRNA2_/TRDRNA2_185334_c0_seq1.p1  ORF type:complete len:404 (-),score=57.38 gnl/TRDRNA2_/TRDRNA2_185334_c0_seq1:61-1272(-)
MTAPLTGDGGSTSSFAAAKAAAEASQAEGNQAWAEGVVLATKGLKRGCRNEHYDRALAKYREGLRVLERAGISPEHLRSDPAVVSLLGDLHAACAQVLLAQQVSYTAMLEARQSIELLPDAAPGQWIFAQAVLQMEKAEEMYYDEAEDRPAILLDVRQALLKLPRNTPVYSAAEQELEYCEKLIKAGAPTDPDGSRSFQRSASVSRLTRPNSATSDRPLPSAGGKVRFGPMSACGCRPGFGGSERCVHLGASGGSTATAAEQPPAVGKLRPSSAGRVRDEAKCEAAYAAPEAPVAVVGRIRPSSAGRVVALSRSHSETSIVRPAIPGGCVDSSGHTGAAAVNREHPPIAKLAKATSRSSTPVGLAAANDCAKAPSRKVPSRPSTPGVRQPRASPGPLNSRAGA